MDKVGNMTGHKPADNWLDPKKGGLQKNPSKRPGAAMGPPGKRVKGPQIGPNGGEVQESRYSAVEEPVFVPPTQANQDKQEELRKKLGY